MLRKLKLERMIKNMVFMYSKHHGFLKYGVMKMIYGLMKRNQLIDEEIIILVIKLVTRQITKRMGV